MGTHILLKLLRYPKKLILYHSNKKILPISNSVQHQIDFNPPKIVEQLSQKVSEPIESPKETQNNCRNMFSSIMTSGYSFPFFNSTNNLTEGKPTLTLQNPYTLAQAQFSSKDTSNDSVPNPNPVTTSNRLTNFSNTTFIDNTPIATNNTLPIKFDALKKFAESINVSPTIQKPNTVEIVKPNEPDTGADPEIDSNCIKLSNMCSSTSYSDIRKFFSGLYIPTNGIKMINDKHGLRIGISYIRFIRSTSVQKALVRNGTFLRTKKVFLEPVTDEEFESVVDSFRPQRIYRFQDAETNKPQKTEPNRNIIKVDDDENNIRTEKTTTPEQIFSVLILEDLPPFAKEQDIMKMFSSYTIIDIFLTRRKDGRKEYEYISYVRFHRSDDAKSALNDKSRHIIGHRQIFAKPSSEEELERAREENNAEAEKKRIEIEEKERIRMQEIENDRLKERNDYSDMNSFENDEDDNDMSNADDNDEKSETNELSPENNFDCQMPTNNIPSLLNLNSDIPIDPRRRHNISSSNRFGLNDNDNNKHQSKFIMLRNCPYKCSTQDIGEFFVSHNFIPNRIEILRNHRNQSCGECIVDFQTFEDAEHSLNLNNANMCGRNIRIEMVTNEEVANRLGPNFVNFSNSNHNLPNFPMQQMNQSFNEHPHQSNEIFGFRKNRFNDCRQRGGNNYYESNINSNNSKNNNNRFGIRRMEQRPRFPDDQTFNRTDNGKNSTKIETVNPIENQIVERFPQPTQTSIPDKFSRAGCVIALSNVPYKANTEDILKFFDGFNLREEDVIRRYNDDGTATGDARIAFPSAEAAGAALDNRNRKNQKIFSRNIYLSLL